MTNQTAPERIVTFSQGLPGFEDCRRFILVASPSLDPFRLLQGTGPTTGPSFVGIDTKQVDTPYRTSLAPADLARLDARPSDKLVWLALVAAQPDGRATVNLRAPIVINPASMQGIQVLAHDSPYTLAHPLNAA
jgi:flagellar assembly factor FliW